MSPYSTLIRKIFFQTLAVIRNWKEEGYIAIINSPFGVLKCSGKVKMNVITIATHNLRKAVFVMSPHMTPVWLHPARYGRSLPALSFISAALEVNAIHLILTSFWVRLKKKKKRSWIETSPFSATAFRKWPFSKYFHTVLYTGTLADNVKKLLKKGSCLLGRTKPWHHIYQCVRVNTKPQYPQ